MVVLVLWFWCWCKVGTQGFGTEKRKEMGIEGVYGMEVVLPFEVEVPSLRILAESRLKESEWAQARFD